MEETNSKQKITPYLWFDDQAEEAANFYVSIFSSSRSASGEKNSEIGSISRYGDEGAEVSGRPSGTVMTVEFRLKGQEFIALNGGPEFKFTPAISFFVSCETEAEINDLWGKLSDRGEILMPLNQYPFSEKFGWVNDKFGVSWQLNLARSEQKITPFLLFVGKQHAKTEEAIGLYTSLFANSRVINIEHFGTGEGEPEGTVKHAKFTLNGQEFMAMDSNLEHHFTFTEAISFFVHCTTQEEVDELWENLTGDGGEEGPCGWLKDKYGVSWQIIPNALTEMLADQNADKAERVMQAMLKMKKIDIEGLKEAYAIS
jgi:predicted 3-demethylubiquinone-9 3-methyltransferase (glyoxalase superfamily)